MKSRPIDEPFDGPSHMMDGAEPLVYTASEYNKMKERADKLQNKVQELQELLRLIKEKQALVPAFYLNDAIEGGEK